MLRKVFVKWQKFAVARRPRVLTDEEELQIKFLINWQAKIKRRKELMRSQSLDSLDLTETFAKKREKDFDEDEEEIGGRRMRRRNRRSFAVAYCILSV